MSQSFAEGTSVVVYTQLNGDEIICPIPVQINNSFSQFIEDESEIEQFSEEEYYTEPFSMFSENGYEFEQYDEIPSDVLFSFGNGYEIERSIEEFFSLNPFWGVIKIGSKMRSDRKSFTLCAENVGEMYQYDEADTFETEKTMIPAFDEIEKSTEDEARSMLGNDLFRMI
jgi:hypothetical protein